jgi:hypothetical protein
MLEQVPVITAYALQECTNSHAYNIAQHLGIMHPSDSSTDKAYSSHARVNAGSSSSDREGRRGKGRSNDYGDDVNDDDKQSLYPSTPEEYAVLAIRLQTEPRLRLGLQSGNKQRIVEMVRNSKTGPSTHGLQLVQFIQSVVS